MWMCKDCGWRGSTPRSWQATGYYQSVENLACPNRDCLSFSISWHSLYDNPKREWSKKDKRLD